MNRMLADPGRRTGVFMSHMESFPQRSSLGLDSLDMKGGLIDLVGIVEPVPGAEASWFRVGDFLDMDFSLARRRLQRVWLNSTRGAL